MPISADKRKKMEALIARLKRLQEEASGDNMANFAHGDDLLRRRVALEKKLLDEDIDTFYREEKEQHDD